MNKVFSLKPIRLSQVLTILLAGVLALFTVACNGAVQAKIPGGGPDVPGQVQPYEGGMNNFSDVDTNRRDRSTADAKAKALKDTVERRINTKGVDSVDQYVDNFKSGTPLGERTKRVADDARRGVENATDDLKDATDRASDKIGRGLDTNAKAAGRAVDNAKDNTKAAGDDLVQGAKRAADKVAD